jgi:hypothetical protein
MSYLNISELEIATAYNKSILFIANSIRFVQKIYWTVEAVLNIAFDRSDWEWAPRTTDSSSVVSNESGIEAPAPVKIEIAPVAVEAEYVEPFVTAESILEATFADKKQFAKDNGIKFAHNISEQKLVDRIYAHLNISLKNQLIA